MDTVLQALVTELRDGHGCHTVLLYGSHARGDATPQSDYDVLGIRAEGPALRDARLWRGTWLDAFVVPEVDLATPGEPTCTCSAPACCWSARTAAGGCSRRWQR